MEETQTAETTIKSYKHNKKFLEDLRRYTEYGWGPGITAALLNRWHPVALTNLDVIRLRRRLGRAAAPAQDAGSDEPPRH